MASIGGICLKGVTNFKGHEGEPCIQGSIYYNGKKVGTYSDSYNMGAPDIRIDSEEFKLVYAEIVKKNYLENHKDSKLAGSDYWWQQELLFSDLRELVEREKNFIKYSKKGYKVMVLTANGGIPQIMKLYGSRQQFEIDTSLSVYDQIEVFDKLEDFAR